MSSFHDDSDARLKEAQSGGQPVHGLPGEGVPVTPGGTPWVPSGTPTGTQAPTGGPPTGTKPPGWSTVFLHILQGLISNPSFDAKHGLDASIVVLIGELTDSVLAHYPAEFGA